MCATATYSVSFARALLEVTRPEFLLADPNRQKITANSKAAQSILELESESLVEDLKALEASYGTDILTLTVVCAYVRRLLANVPVERYLTKHYSDALGVFRSTLADSALGRVLPTPSKGRLRKDVASVDCPDRGMTTRARSKAGRKNDHARSAVS